MSSLKTFLLPLALLAAPLAAHAQDWRDDGGNGRYGRSDREQKEVFWDGNCRVVRSVDQDGELQEKRRCRGDRNAYERARGDGGERESSRYAASGEREDRVRRRDGDDAVQPEIIGFREVPPPPAPPVHVARVLRAPASVAVTVLPRTAALPVAARTPTLPVAARTATPVGVRPARAPRAVQAPAPRLAAKAARKMIPAAPAPAPRLLAKAAPAPRLAAKVAPRLLAKAIPAPREATKAAPAPRLVAKAAPAAGPRLLVKAKPAPAGASRIAVKPAPLVHAPRLVVKAVPAVKAPRILAPQQPVVLAKAAPALAPKAPLVVARSMPHEVAPRTVVLRSEPVVAAPAPKLAVRVEPAVAATPPAPTVESGALTVGNVNVYRNPYSIVPDRRDKYSNLH